MLGVWDLLRVVYYDVSVMVFRFVVVLVFSLLSVCVCCMFVIWLRIGWCLLVSCGGVLLDACCLSCVYYVLVFWFVGCFGLWLT